MSGEDQLQAPATCKHLYGDAADEYQKLQALIEKHLKDNDEQVARSESKRMTQQMLVDAVSNNTTIQWEKIRTHEKATLPTSQRAKWKRCVISRLAGGQQRFPNGGDRVSASFRGVAHRALAEFVETSVFFPFSFLNWH